jgi:chromosome segregation ATPase
MTTAEGDIDAVEGRMSTAESDIDSLEGRMSSAESSISNLSSTKADKSYVDSQDAGLQSQIDAVEGRMDTAEGNISNLSSTKADKSYVDAQLASAQSNIDDVEGYAQDIRDDLDAEIARAEAAESALDGRLDAIEGMAFYKESKVIASADLSYFELAREAKPYSVKAFVGRIALHEGQDFSISVVGGKTRLTWSGDFMVGGAEEIEEGMKLFFEYYC